MSTISINTSKIPDWSRYVLLQAVHNDMEQFFSQPGVKERFELWKQQKVEEQKGGKA